MFLVVAVAAKHALCLHPQISYTFIRSNSILINDNLRCDATQSEIEAKTICGTWLTDSNHISTVLSGIFNMSYVFSYHPCSVSVEKGRVWGRERGTRKERETGLRHVTGGMAAPTRTASLSFHAKILARERAVKLSLHCCIPYKNCVCAISKFYFFEKFKIKKQK